MLHPLIFSLFFTPYAEASSCASCSKIQELQEESLKKVEALKQDKSFQSFQHHLLTNQETFFKSQDFQEALSSFAKHKEIPMVTPSDPGEFYIFASFSLGEKALLDLAREAQRYGATLVLRGFKACPREGGEPNKINYAKTVYALYKIVFKTDQGFTIDPELFTLFSVKAVPTFVLTKPFELFSQERNQTPLHDRLQGHVSAQYALEIFAKGGDLKESAQALLNEGQAK